MVFEDQKEADNRSKPLERSYCLVVGLVVKSLFGSPASHTRVLNAHVLLVIPAFCQCKP